MGDILVDATMQAAVNALTYGFTFAIALILMVGLHYYIKWRIKRAVKAATDAILNAPRQAAVLAITSATAGVGSLSDGVKTVSGAMIDAASAGSEYVSTKVRSASSSMGFFAADKVEHAAKLPGNGVNTLRVAKTAPMQVVKHSVAAIRGRNVGFRVDW